MKKRLLSLLIALITVFTQILPIQLSAIEVTPSPDIAINETNFPDPIFREYVSTNFDTDDDGELTPTERNSVTQIEVQGTYYSVSALASLSGIEYFPNLEALNCSYTAITSLDFSYNYVLDCFNLNGIATTASLIHSDGVYKYDLGALVGSANKGRITAVSSGTYDPVTGIVTFTTEPTSFTYTYDTNKGGVAGTTFDVTVEKYSERITIDETHFPDPIFRAYVSTNLDMNHDDVMDETERKAITIIQVQGSYVTPRSIASLVGIEYFPNLQTLYCYLSSVTSLDVSKNTELTEISCYHTGITALDVSNNTKLTTLNCYNTGITALDVSNNTKLTTLNCSGTGITSLDLTNQTSLTSFYFSNILTTAPLTYSDGVFSCDLGALVGSVNKGRITAVSPGTYNATTGIAAFTKDPTIFTYTYDTNKGGVTGTTFNVTVCGYLESITIDETHFPDPIFRAYVSTNFDTDSDGVLNSAERRAVTGIDVQGSYETRSAIASLIGIEYFPCLQTLFCGYTDITTLDVSKNTELTELSCYNTDITTLDVSKNTELTELSCYNTDITALDVSKNTELTKLYCSNTRISALDVSKNTELTELYCSSTGITVLDVSYNTELTNLNCSGTGITALDVSYNTELTELSCYNTGITVLDVSVNTKLWSLEYSNTDITALDVSENTALQFLYCSNTDITSLDASHNTALRLLYCNNTCITSLDLTNHTSLTNLYLTSSAASAPLTYSGGVYSYDLGALVGSANKGRITAVNSGTYDPATGIVTFAAEPTRFSYTYDTNKGGVAGTTFDVTVDRYLESITVDETHFPDPIFRAYVSTNFDTNSDGILNSAERRDVKSIYVQDTPETTSTLASLVGIEYFPCLQTLVCGYTDITTLDVSKNTELRSLNCAGTGITSLDLTYQTSLTSFYSSSIKTTAPMTYSGGVYCYDLGALVGSANKGRITAVSSGTYDPATGILTLTKAQASFIYTCDTNKGGVAGTTFNVTVNGYLESITIDETHFPDPIFREYVSTNFDTDSDGILNTAEIKDVIFIDVKGTHVTRSVLASLVGIEYFPYLQTLLSSYTDITTLDLSHNTALTYVYCGNTGITALDLTNQTSLSTLTLTGNSTTAPLTYSGGVYSYDLGALVGSANKGRITAVSSGTYNPATGIVTFTTAPTSISYTYDTNKGGVAGTTFDVTVDRYLESITVDKTHFPDPIFRAYVSTNFDTNSDGILNSAEMKAVTYINLRGTNATRSAIASLAGIEYFPYLQTLLSNYTNITTLDVSKNTDLVSLGCLGTGITSLDVSKNTELWSLDCAVTGITSLDVSKNTELSSLNCAGTGITSLDVSKNTELRSLNCAGTGITSLDVSKNAELWSLDCADTGITALDVGKNTELWSLDCSGTGITALDVSKNTELKSLDCADTDITALGVSKNTELLSLDCSGTGITALDVSKNTELRSLDCTDTGITALDLTNQNSLSTLTLTGNSTIAPLTYSGGAYSYDLGALVGSANKGRITAVSSGTYDPVTGIVIFNAAPRSFSYTYDTNKGGVLGTTFDVTFPLTVQSISIKAAPTKLTYFAGDALVTTGLVLTLHYNNSTIEDVTTGFTTACDLTTAGTKTVTVTHSSKTATFDVTVNPVTQSSTSSTLVVIPPVVSSIPVSSAVSSSVPESAPVSSAVSSSTPESAPVSSAVSSSVPASVPASSAASSSVPASVPATSSAASSAPVSSQTESMPVSEPDIVEECIAVIGQLLPQGVTGSYFATEQEKTETIIQTLSAIDDFVLSMLTKDEINRPNITQQQAQVIEQTYRDAYAAANPGKTALLDLDTGISMISDNFSGSEQAIIYANLLTDDEVYQEALKLVENGEILFAYDIKIDGSVPGPKELTFRVPGFEGRDIVIAHKLDSGEWETYKATVSDDGFATITVTTLSPFVGYIDSAPAVNPLFIYIGLAVVIVAGAITAVLLLRRKKSA